VKFIWNFSAKFKTNNLPIYVLYSTDLVITRISHFSTYDRFYNRIAQTQQNLLKTKLGNYHRMMCRNSSGIVMCRTANFHSDQPDILHTHRQPNVTCKGKGRENGLLQWRHRKQNLHTIIIIIIIIIITRRPPDYSPAIHGSARGATSIYCLQW